MIQIAPIVDYKVRGLCAKGCMNFGVRGTCPPKAPLFDKYFDLSYPVYAVINEFDLAAQAAKMKALHPKWTDKQCRCSRYWQKGARKKLINKMDQLIATLPPGYESTWCPEGMGVDVTGTLLLNLGIQLWPVADIVRQVGFICMRRK